jgi:hemerythrin-like domain-containing protein
MCEYCGCRGVTSIGELMEEHVAILDEVSRIRAALRSGDRAAARSLVAELVGHLHRHVRREEDGVFAALRAQGEFVDEVGELEREHVALDEAIAVLDVDAPDLEQRLTRLFDELAEHIEREDLGIFPVSVVTLGARGWDLVEQAHRQSPSFLHAPVDRGPRDDAPPGAARAAAGGADRG